MAGKAWDLSACALCAVAVVAFALLGVASAAPVAVRASLAIPLVLVLSGWTAAAALRPVPGLPFEEHLTFALGLGTALAVLGGLVLNVTPWGLRAESWGVYEGAVTLVCSAVALARGYRRRPAVRAALARSGAWQMGLVLAAVALSIVAVIIARAGALDPHNGAFTAFSMQRVSSGGQSAVRLQATNEENRDETYSVRVVQGSTTLREWTAIALAPGQSWQATLSLPPSSNLSEPTDAYLYRATEPGSPYRSVSLWPGAGAGQ